MTCVCMPLSPTCMHSLQATRLLLPYATLMRVFVQPLTPYTLHFKPYTLHLHPAPYILHPTPTAFDLPPLHASSTRE